MTPEQRLFNEAWTHILNQGKPSLVPGYSTCKYKSEAGLGCAFAPAIQDYSSKLENKSARHLLKHHASKLFPWARELDPDFAYDVQGCHDDAASGAFFRGEVFIESFKDKMVALAEQHDLEVPA